jgi:glycosyltransferase involved in cell wall biosynthesis
MARINEASAPPVQSTWTERLPGARVVRRVLGVARSAGWKAAAGKVARKIGSQSMIWLEERASRWPLAALIGDGRPRTLDPYAAWLLRNQETESRRERIRLALDRMAGRPLFSIVMSAAEGDGPGELLDRAIKSVVAQTYDTWELLIATRMVRTADPSPGSRAEGEPSSLEAWCRCEGRIRLSTGTIDGDLDQATSAAATEARGTHLAFLDARDQLDHEALAHMALHLEEHPEHELVYTDDDEISSDGRRQSPCFKPDWSPELLLRSAYLGPLCAIGARLFREIGGMRAGFGEARRYDLWLRASERARGVGHIAQVLCHRPAHPGWSPKRDCQALAGARAVELALARRGVAGKMVQPRRAVGAGSAGAQPVMPDQGPTVAILVIRTGPGPLATLLESIKQTSYHAFKVYVVDQWDGPRQTSGARYIDLPHLESEAPLAAVRNAAAGRVTEDLLLFLDQHLKTIDPGWLSQLVGWSQLPGVGAVGARIVRQDRRLESAGLILGLRDGLIGPALENLPRVASGREGLAWLTRNCEAVPAHCLLTPRALFLSSGGFDEVRFPCALYDADYGLRLGALGYRSVVCQEAELLFQKGYPGALGPAPHELAAFRSRYWNRADRYYSPHFSLEDGSFRVRPTVMPVAAGLYRIRLLAVTHNLNWEGAPLIQFDLIKRMLEQRAIRPLVLSPTDGPLRARYEENGMEVRVAGDLCGGSIDPGPGHEPIERLADWIKQKGIELVHASTATSYWSVAAAREAGVPAVWSIHESMPWQIQFGGLEKPEARRVLALLDHPYRVVFASRGSSAIWKPLERVGNFTIVPTPLDMPRFEVQLAGHDRESARRQLDLEEGDLFLLLLGTICDRKGQHDLALAFARLEADVARRLRCFVVGARDYIAYARDLRRLAGELPADRRDRFQVVDETGLTAPYWKAADIFCCTSRIESYPRVILEAMACGLPIVTTPVFGIAEQVYPDVNALCYEPGDDRTLANHLTRLVQDGALRQRMAQQSPWVLRSLPSHEAMVVEYLDIFRSAALSSVPNYSHLPGCATNHAWRPAVQSTAGSGDPRPVGTRAERGR